MIFKTLFTPKWKHPKLATRLNAVEQLDSSQSKDLQILNQLAFSDESVEVRRKALTKLNDIKIWWQAFKEEQEHSIKEMAEKQVMNAVLNQNDSLPAQCRTDYIDRCGRPQVLEKLALTDSDLALRLKLLKRLAKANLIETAFNEADEAFQLQLMDLIEQYSLLRTVKNKAQGQAAAVIADKLEAQKLAKEMPPKVEKEVQLILAKLNALREKNDYLAVKADAIALYDAWNNLELQWLATEQKETFKEKFRLLETKLEQKIASLAAAYEQEQQRIEQANEIKAQQAALNDALAQLEAKIETAMADLSHQQLEQLQQMQRNCDALLKITPNVAADVQQRYQGFAKKVALLPEVISAVAAINQQLNAYSALVVPADQASLETAQQAFSQWQNDTKQSINALPKELVANYRKPFNSLVKQWQEQVAPISQELVQLQTQCHKKLKDLKRLINQGRFNVAFGVFKGMDQLYQELTPSYQETLQKEYQQVEEQLANAKDWQQYVGEPKREALIEELKEFVQTQCTDPKARAEQVKKFRSQWNELGKTISEQDKQNGEIFNQLVEAAFVPCREYFAEQEAIRAQNIIEREAIISKMQALHSQLESTEFDLKAVESEFNKLTKAWRSAGSVETKAFKPLLESYKVAERPITTAIRTMHRTHAEQKAELVAQAKLLVESDDVFSAANEIKELQKKWKTIGFAGNKQEPELWQRFRAYNDELFAKRDTYKSEQDERNIALTAQWLNELAQLREAFNEISQNKSQLVELQQQLATFTAQVGSDSKKVQEGITTLNQLIENAISTINSKQVSENYHALFAALEQNEAPQERWIKKVSTHLTREQLLVRIEILSQVPSATTNETLRMSEQVAMLNERMSGQELDRDQLLLLWVNQGELTDAHREQLTVLKQLYTA
ncbi:DUF349 domain-containing protein [Pseudoalteromonas tunicata]|uniref:DUF349 domain-containing protein n=1 Tax=Pseudoalteromonas tunicata TaxID=314281 RepID=UPI00273D8A13|nr:DUF349 domain-containing protein [Pseudoalteromonas tunicata]MDP5215472.1 DUF349 domain-containing protein [Pseudoalteromonas tunicata]